MITIRLDGNPRGKGRPRFGNGRAYTPDETRDYENALRREAQYAMRVAACPIFTGPIRIAVLAEMEVPKDWAKWKREAALTGTIRPTTKPDADNILKMLDALNPHVRTIGGKKIVEPVVWSDDVVVVEVDFAKCYSERPGLTIEVLAITEAVAAQITRRDQLPAAQVA
jgi:Holliday junction resolvase RusA-like endonuclease